MVRLKLLRAAARNDLSARILARVKRTLDRRTLREAPPKKTDKVKR